MKRTWKEKLHRAAMDWYRHGWAVPQTLEEFFETVVREHKSEAAREEMAAYFKTELEWACEFYADKKTVAALMAYSD